MLGAEGEDGGHEEGVGSGDLWDMSLPEREGGDGVPCVCGV